MLSENEIQLEFDMLRFSAKLERLDLRNNKIYSIQKGTFQYLVNLKILVLSLNYLTELAAHDFTGLIALTRLELSNNQIKSIDRLMFDNLPKLQEIGLQENVCAKRSFNLNQSKETLFEEMKDCVGTASAVILNLSTLVLALIVSLI